MAENGSLSAIEAFVLLNPTRTPGPQALKLAMMALLAQGSVAIATTEQEGFFGRLKRTVRLRARPERAAAFPGGASLVTLVGAEGCTMPVFVAGARRAYGAGFAGFLRREVRPAMQRRGLLEPRLEQFLLLFERTRWYRTEAGEREFRRVEQAMAQARAIPDYLDRDPAQAAAIAVSLGTTILLVDELKPHYQRLSQAMRDRGDGGSVGDSSGGSRDSTDGGVGSDRQVPTAQPDDLDSLCLADFDLAGIDSFDSAMDTFDSGFDAAGGDGGDGGGDGGSSGC